MSEQTALPPQPAPNEDRRSSEHLFTRDRAAVTEKLLAVPRAEIETQFTWIDDPAQKEQEVQAELDRAIQDYESLVMPGYLTDYLTGQTEDGQERMEKVKQDLENEGRHILELGREEDPAHAVRISLRGMDPLWSGYVSGRALGVWTRFCDTYPDFFKHLKSKPGEDSICGFLVPGEGLTVEELLFLLKTEFLPQLQETLQGHIADLQGWGATEARVPDILTVVSEVPESGIGLFVGQQGVQLEDNQPFLLAEAINTKGLTAAALATNHLLAQQSLNVNSPATQEIHWVTPADEEAQITAATELKKLGLTPPPELDGIKRRRQSLVEKLGEKEMVTGKSGAGIVLRSVEPLFEQMATEGLEQKFADYRLNQTREPLGRGAAQQLRNNLSELPNQEGIADIEAFKISAAPDMHLLYRLYPNWQEDLEQLGVVEFAVPQAGIMKIDISGMTKLAQESKVDPGQFMIEVLLEYIPYLNDAYGKDNYLTYLDGDAVVVVVLEQEEIDIVAGRVQPDDEQSKADIQAEKLQSMKQFLDLTQRSGAAFPQMIERIADNYPDIKHLIDEIDVKMIMYKSMDPSHAASRVHAPNATTMSLAKGGLFYMSNPILKHAESQAEAGAKRNYYTDTVISDQPLTDEEMKYLFGDQSFGYSETNDADGSAIKARMYHLEMHKPVLEARMEDLVQRIINADPEQTTALGEAWHEAEIISHQPEVRQQLSEVSNLAISYAKNVLFLQLLNEKDPRLGGIFWQTTQEMLNPDTTHKLETINTIVNQDLTGENIEKEYQLIIDAYQVMAQAYNDTLAQAA